MARLSWPCCLYCSHIDPIITTTVVHTTTPQCDNVAMALQSASSSVLCLLCVVLHLNCSTVEVLQDSIGDREGSVDLYAGLQFWAFFSASKSVGWLICGSPFMWEYTVNCFWEIKATVLQIYTDVALPSHLSEVWHLNQGCLLIAVSARTNWNILIVINFFNHD